MDARFKSYLLKKASKRSPPSLYQRFQDQCSDPSESARQEIFADYGSESESDCDGADAVGCRRSLFSFDISGFLGSRCPQCPPPSDYIMTIHNFSLI